MPLYDYKCTNCSHRFEIRQPFGSESVLSCPECGREAGRQYHSMAIIYKGSGFYTTDYARKHVSPAGDSSSSNGSSGEAGEAKSGDSKSGESTSSEPKADSKASESKSGSSAETSTATSSDSSSGSSHSHPH